MADITKRKFGHKAVDAFPAIAFVVVAVMVLVVYFWD